MHDENQIYIFIGTGKQSEKGLDISTMLKGSCNNHFVDNMLMKQMDQQLERRLESDPKNPMLKMMLELSKARKEMME